MMASDAFMMAADTTAAIDLGGPQQYVKSASLTLWSEQLPLCNIKSLCFKALHIVQFQSLLDSLSNHTVTLTAHMVSHNVHTNL